MASSGVRQSTVRLRPIDLAAYQHLGPGTFLIGQGAQVARPGDWIVTDTGGRKHVFTNNSLRAMCEPIEGAT